MPKDAYYFSHDSNAKDDPKCSMLIEQLGLEGYGIYWVLVETLRDQPDYRYPLSMIPIVARKYNTTAEKVKVVIGNYGLFTVTTDEFFLSQSLCDRMKSWEELKESKRIAGRKSGMVRRIAAGVPDEERSDLPQVYVIRCFNENEEFVKIGSTNGTISRRFSGNLPYSYSVLRQFFLTDCISLESELHAKFRGYKYWPNINFGGDAECYNIGIIDDIMDYSPETKFLNEHRSNSVQTPLELRKEKKRKEKTIKHNAIERTNTPFEQALADFAEMRRAIKKPLTEAARALLVKKLNRLSTDEQTQIEILNQSTVNCWQGVFALKDTPAEAKTGIDMRGYVEC